MSKIEWTDKTWNPITGCDKVSPGCDNCYAATIAKRFWRDRPFEDVQFHPKRIDQPLEWKKPRRVFVCSMGDLFHKSVKDDDLVHIYETMAAADNHTFQVLTKRSSVMRDFLHNEDCLLDLHSYRHVWHGVSVETPQQYSRINHLREIKAPLVKFLSVEPMLAPMPDLPLDGIDWVIVGGESGAGARDMNPDWARDVRDQCKAAGVAFFMKQMAHKRPIPNDLMIREFPA